MKKLNSFTNNYFQQIIHLKQFNNARIGFMGGSFNPPHNGHLYITEGLINKFKLNAIFWLLTPQNPLKNKNDLLPLSKRFELCTKLTRHNPKIQISTIENHFSNAYTYNTIIKLKKFMPQSNQLFWIMGEDNLYNFDKFYNWQQIAENIAIITIAREKDSFKTLLQKAPSTLKKYFVNENDFNNIKTLPNLTFWLTKKKDISSTAIRKHNKDINNYAN